jgi:hypothetical protein
VGIENRPLAALINRLEAESRVWLRIAATQTDHEWRINLVEATLGDPPPGWRRRRWRYPRARFVAATRPGTTVATWLKEGRLRLRPPVAALDLAGWVQVERRESAFASAFQPLPWPSVVWTVGTNSDVKAVPHDELVAADAPAFLSFDQAATVFFGLPSRTIRNFGGQEVVIRDQDRRARIDRVTIRPNDIVVRVRGDSVGETRLTLGGEQAPSANLSSGVDEVRLTLGSPLGEGAWLALHRDDELLDRRILDPSWQSTDVEVELDALTRVQILISRGEGPSTEFKRELPVSDARRVMKTAAAFANGDGGTLLPGVDNEGGVVGIGDENPRNAADRVASLLTDWVRPRIHFNLELVTIDTATVLVADVFPGADTPYGVGTTDRVVTYYVRRGGNSFPATPDDVRAFVRDRMPAPRHPLRDR